MIVYFKRDDLFKMSNDNQNNNKKKFSFQSNNAMGIAAIVVVGIFIICVIWLLATALFPSNNGKVDSGLYTGTQSPESSVAAKDSSKADANDNDKDKDSKSDDTSSDDTSADSSESKAEDESSITDSSEADGDKAYVTKYEYLVTEPSEDAEHIVCMSPNFEVTVLEKLDNGYWKLRINNMGTILEGYANSEYLSSTPVS